MTANPRHQRLALRQRPHPHRPSGRVLQTDIWVRFQKLRGRRCVYICADDTHGTAIMIRARQEGIREEELIAKMQQAHVADFAGFDIEFDNYGSTNSPETRAVCVEIWAALRKAGLVEEQEVTQLYDATAGTFLADRFVKGTCPKCKSPNQYGDSCDKCGAHYSPTDLIDPVSTLSGSKPEIRKADHLFVNIEKLHGFLEEWTQQRRAPSAGDRQLPEGPFPGRAAARLGRLAAGALFRLRDSRQSGQLLVRLVRRPDRLHGLDAAVVRPARREVRRLVAQRREDGNPPLHRQGHHLFPHAVLAGHAEDGRLQPAGEGPHPRLSDRQRREDVEEQGDVHPGVDVSGAPRPVVPAILLRLEAVFRRGRHRPELRGVHRQGQRRHGRQRRQPRQPHGAVRREDRPGRRVSGRRRACSPRPRPTATQSPRPTRRATTAGPCA